MASLPIFDANAHPTLNSKWFDDREGVSFPSLVTQMEKGQIRRACAVGMYGVGDYDSSEFIHMCNINETLVPVAGINPDNISDAESEINKIKEMGFVGVKIHPRICNMTLGSSRLHDVLTACSQVKLPVFLCTYYWKKGESIYKNNFDALVRLIAEFDELPLLLLHGGVHDILKLSEVARHYPNVLMDLSLTMMKYEKSSLDMDIEFLFHSFDRRICVGSDQPEYDYMNFRRRFEYFSRDISEEKAINIAYKNLAVFLGINEAVFTV